MKRARFARAAAGLIVPVLLAACGGVDPTVLDAADQLTLGVPPIMGNLTVEVSKKATRKMQREAQKRETYVRDATVFELRDGEQLRAVFQVIRLTPDARPERRDFRDKIVLDIGQTSTKPIDFGGASVYRVEANDQIIHVWFEGRFMQVLLVQKAPEGSNRGVGVDIDRLLAEALALEPRPAA